MKRVFPIDHQSAIFLSPGDLFIAEQPVIISTILGSCISICLYSPFQMVGAMCHCLLPFSGGKTGPQPFRYVDEAANYMIRKMMEKKIPKNYIVSKVFGGADMFADSTHNLVSIGKQNIEAAKKILLDYQISIIKEDVGGCRGRKIFFNTANGEVFLKKISSSI